MGQVGARIIHDISDGLRSPPPYVTVWGQLNDQWLSGIDLFNQQQIREKRFSRGFTKPPASFIEPIVYYLRFDRMCTREQNI